MTQMHNQDSTDGDAGQNRLDFTADSLFDDARRLMADGAELTEFERKGLAAAAEYRRRRRENLWRARSQRTMATLMAANADPMDRVLDRLDTLVEIIRHQANRYPQVSPAPRRPAPRAPKEPEQTTANVLHTDRPEIDL